MSTITAPAEQKIVDAGPQAAVHRRRVARRQPRARSRSRIPSTGESLCDVADASTDDAKAALDAAVDGRPRVGRARRRASAARSCAARSRRSSRSADELALLMTLEMGKPLAESKAEIAYAAEFFRWFSEEAVRIDGRYAVDPNGQGRAADDEAAGRPVPADHAVELPAGDGHAQDRPGDRGRLHDGGQAGPADAAVDARCWPRSSRRPACPAACSTSSPPRPRARRWRR